MVDDNEVLEPKALPLSDDIRFVDVSCGIAHAAALCSNLNVYVWGKSSQYGTNAYLQPTLVKSIADVAIIKLFANCTSDFTFFRSLDHVYAFGLNSKGEMRYAEEEKLFLTPSKVLKLRHDKILDIWLGESSIFVSCPHFKSIPLLRFKYIDVRFIFTGLE
jgi:alpha-tubulin suppressor-like RCC1 family protein